MNEMLELSRHPEYVHVLLSHVPVVGLGLALVVLCVGLIKADRALTLTGLVMEGVREGSILYGRNRRSRGETGNARPWRRLGGSSLETPAGAVHLQTCDRFGGVMQGGAESGESGHSPFPGCCPVERLAIGD